MRQIKFRVWHKVAKAMSAVATLQFLYDKEGVYAVDNIDFMQFTGLQDKTGKDIYEGDLLMVKDSRICEVVFHSCAGCWDLILRNAISSLPIGAVSPASYQYHTEVIGNIYENPELLK
jgi:hypothetical protein